MRISPHQPALEGRRHPVMLHSCRGKSTLDVSLATLDDKVAEALRNGAIRLLSPGYLLAARPDRICRQQELPQEAFLKPRQAVAALRSCKRRIFVLSFGWGAFANPDPSGEILRHVLRFLDWWKTNFNISQAQLRRNQFGLFWDFASLPQHPRNAAETRLSLIHI